jgi:translation initiation factor 5A
MSTTEFVQTSSLRVGNLIVVDGKPCKILAMSSAKPGKHGAAKTIFDTRNLLTGKNVQTSAASKGMMSVPQTKRETYTVLDVKDDLFMTLMKDGQLREDVQLQNDEHGNMITDLLQQEKSPEVTLMTVLDHVLITNVSESP